MQATSDKTASANFTQTVGTLNNVRGIAGNVTNGIDGYNNYYQWGRKDAFRSSEYTEAPGLDKDVIFSDESVTVGINIKNPTTFYVSSDEKTYTCYSPAYYNAWNATYTSYSTATTSSPGLDTVIKTVYDPSPVGYTVPAGNLFVGLTMDTFPLAEVGKGRVYTSNGKTLFLPMSGYRRFTGEVQGVDGSGWYWEAVSASAYSGRSICADPTRLLLGASAGTGFGQGEREIGCNIRPVREN